MTSQFLRELKLALVLDLERLVKLNACIWDTCIERKTQETNGPWFGGGYSPSWGKGEGIWAVKLSPNSSREFCSPLHLSLGCTNSVWHVSHCSVKLVTVLRLSSIYQLSRSNICRYWRSSSKPQKQQLSPWKVKRGWGREGGRGNTVCSKFKVQVSGSHH